MSESTKDTSKGKSRVLNYGSISVSEQKQISPLVKEFSTGDNANTLPGNIVPFFTNFNDYAIQLLYAASSSSTHLSCIRSKVFFGKGDGFVIKEGKPSKLKVETKSEAKLQETDIEKMTTLYEEANADGESLADIYEKLLIDNEFIGNYYLLLKEVTVNDKVRTYAIHLSALNCLVTLKKNLTDKQFVCYHPDWSQVTNPDADKTMKKYPVYPEWSSKDGGIRYTVIHGMTYMPGKTFYGLPESIASLIYQQMEQRVGEFNIDEFDNGFSGNTLIQGVSNDEPEKVAGFRRSIEKTFKGRKKKRIFINIPSDESGLLKVDEISKVVKEGKFLELDKLGTQKILTAHRWYTSLAGIEQGGKLNTSSEAIINDFQIAYNTVIRPIQNHFVEKVFSKYLKANGVEKSYFDITNSVPVSFMGKIDVNSILTDDELRIELGFAAATAEQKAELQAKKKSSAIPNNIPGSN